MGKKKQQSEEAIACVILLDIYSSKPHGENLITLEVLDQMENQSVRKVIQSVLGSGAKKSLIRTVLMDTINNWIFQFNMMMKRYTGEELIKLQKGETL